MAAYVEMLSVALDTSLSQFAGRLMFVANRTKNEAGTYRATLLQWLDEHSFDIVTKSYSEARTMANVANERSAVQSSSVVCQAFTKMLRDDVSKRDSVAKNRFISVSKHLLRCALSQNEKRLPCTGFQLHSVWITEAIRLQWLVTEVIGGEANLRKFTWEIAKNPLTANWVTSSQLEAGMRPLLDDVFSEGEAAILMRRVHAASYTEQALHDSQKVTPSELVALLQEGLGSVKLEHTELTGIPALPRPPACTWALTTHSSPPSSSAAATAASAVSAGMPRGTGMP